MSTDGNRLRDPVAGRQPTDGRVAVIGSGVAGLTAAWLLSRRFHVTLIEAEDRLGGHAHTHQVQTQRGPVQVDSGFIVHNHRTYPLFSRMLRELGVPTRPTQMSMSIRCPRTGFEYAGGRGVSGFLAHPRQLVDRRYLGLLAQVRRFHRCAKALLDDGDDSATFGDFLNGNGFDEDFRRLFAVPLVSCVWSGGPGSALQYPAQYLFRFLANHGMLQVTGSPQWLTIPGGSVRYVQAIAQAVARVQLGAPVEDLHRERDGVVVQVSGEPAQRFRRVVIATHADQALRLLTDPTQTEHEVLSAFTTTANVAVLHRDASLLPDHPWIRASWNYTVPQEQQGPGGPQVTYWMNRLQGFDEREPLLVTLNGAVDPSAVIATMRYRHPVHTQTTLQAQRSLPRLNSATTVFAGAWQGWGFHEDGCRSGVAAAAAFGVPW